VSIVEKIIKKLEEKAAITRTDDPAYLFAYLDRMGMLNERNMADILLIVVQEINDLSKKPNK
jgi:hypothetical protein